ncbi:MAG TPA: type II secretion system F family protein [candidate division WWE3 bacterium]|uniref:Type II secretion system F family protein n=1 Tax=candidate division WWE3 bacterium TaxID=2053526 RepID=A0A7C1HHA7_UNCKA|nr:type II secretion system F family protein [candidate division WWE3 bacterium]
MPKPKKEQKQIQLVKRVKLVEIVNFTKHLSTMLRAGIPIDEGMETLVEQTANPYFRHVLNQSLEDIQNGQTLSEALEKHKNAFSHFYISLIRISEESGTLEENMNFLAEQLNKAYALKKKIQGAMLYPSLIIVAAIGMGGFITVFILPQLVEFFEDFGVDLPLTTKILLGIAKFMETYGIFVFGGIFAFIIGLSFAVKNQKIKLLWHRILLKTPIVGKIIALDQLSKFSRNLGVLLRSGVPISKSLSVTANTLSNLRFRNILNTIEEAVNDGSTIHEILLKGGYKEIPAIFTTMIKVGEKSGTLEESLLYLGDFYEAEIDDFSNNLTTIIEPILLLSIGLSVGFIAVAIVSPIYELTGSF